ncbi:voltage-gated potassium channel [Paraburkholderia sp. BL8N3]|jgi:voltage-gated potassium channel|nr:potassium channel family protein [Paraburkholderia sp. BL8N3]TCK37071.1 voltage-gated potassium channel [Paraburkholderia sp. BL8N3]
MDNVKKAPDSTLHARHVFEEFARIIWYLRSILAALLAIFVLLSAVMYYADGPIEAANGAPPSFGQTPYFCTVTALTIWYGDVLPTTILGRIDAILLGVVGVLMTGVVTAAAVRSLEQASHRDDLREQGQR